MNGLIFKNKHSYTDMGLYMQSKVRHILSEPKTVYEDLPGVDGEYDFSEVNPDGRVKYKPFVDENVFSLVRPNMASMVDKAHEIADWLSCGQAQLIYDNDPNKYYIARVINKLDIENQLIRLKSFTAQFKCQPFAYGLSEVQNVYEGIISAASKVINNPGTYVRPKIKVTGTFTTLTLTCQGKTLTYNAAISGAEIVIDNFQCIKDGAINVGYNLYGTPFEFIHGDNTLEIGGTGLNCTVTVTFRPQYR